jgi:hypothetical protein
MAYVASDKLEIDSEEEVRTFYAACHLRTLYESQRDKAKGLAKPYNDFLGLRTSETAPLPELSLDILHSKRRAASVNILIAEELYRAFDNLNKKLPLPIVCEYEEIKLTPIGNQGSTGTREFTLRAGRRGGKTQEIQKRTGKGR